MGNNQTSLQTYLQSKLSLDKETALQCASLFSFCEYKAGSQIIRMGDVADSMQLVLQGLVRAYYIDENGTEITKCFAKENEWCGFYSYLSEEPSPFFVETLEPTVTARCFASELYLKLMKDHEKEFSGQNEGLNDPINDPINELENLVLEIIKKNPAYTYSEIARQIGKSEATVKRTLSILKKAGVLERDGSKKTGHWIIVK